MVELVVQKYGGTSLQTAERMAQAADRIIKETKKGRQVVVVVSAMGSTTDDLTALAGQVTTRPAARELDLLLSTGEQVSCALMAMALQARGIEADALTGSQAGLETDATYGSSIVKSVDPLPIRQRLEEGKVVVVSGFQGCPGGHEVTTLGRGGSDTTAAVLAAALKAARCEIFTDVDGVYTADPGTIKGAQKYEEMDFESLSALAELGASVVHPRAAEAAKSGHIPLVVRSSFTEQEGTTVLPANARTYAFPVIGVTYETGLSHLSIHGSMDMKKLEEEWKETLNPWKATQHTGGCQYRVIIRDEDVYDTMSFLTRFRGKLAYRVSEHTTGRALVHVVFKSGEEKQNAEAFLQQLPLPPGVIVQSHPHVWSIDVAENHGVDVCQVLHDYCMKRETDPVSAAN